MLSDSALLITGAALAAIVGGALLLRRRTLAAPPTSAVAGRSVAPAAQVEPQPPVATQPMPEPAAYGAHLAPGEPWRGSTTVRRAGGDSAAPFSADPAGPAAGGPVARAPGGGAGGGAGQSRIEALVLRAALEDALEHLVEVYGEEYLDAFYARRLRRNVDPYRELVAAASDPAVSQQGLRQAAEAEEALRKVVASARDRARKANG